MEQKSQESSHIEAFETKQFTSIGGQAVIEGVMMRSPHALVIAVRQADGKIKIKRDQWQGLFKKWSLFKKPFIRGVFVLIETMANGVVALNYSARIALSDEMLQEARKKGVSESVYLESQKKKEQVGMTTWISIIVSVVVGIALFKALPHFLTAFLSSTFHMGLSLENYRFHAIDGIFKALIFLFYVYIIGFIPDIRRVFQYHGAEHKAISTFEAGQELTLENARLFSTFHPRCGTTFIFFLLFISIILFAVLFSLFPVFINMQGFFKHVAAIFTKIALMLPVAGLSYELIKMMGKKSHTWWGTVISMPGILLQRLTTREPDDAQLEVGLASLKMTLALENHLGLQEASITKNIQVIRDEMEVSSLEDITETAFDVNDFLE